jgi:hemin uptake protein HemP
MKPRIRAKVDANQADIVAALRAIPGVSVVVGHDDILVGHHGQTYWYEIKNRAGRNTLQKSQIHLEESWQGHYRVVHDIDDILEDMGIGR